MQVRNYSLAKDRKVIYYDASPILVSLLFTFLPSEEANFLSWVQSHLSAWQAGKSCPPVATTPLD